MCATFVGFLHDFVPSNSCQISTRTKSTSSDVRWPMLNTKLPAGDGKPYVDPPQFLTVTKKVGINVLTNNSNPEMFQKKNHLFKILWEKPALLVNIKPIISPVPRPRPRSWIIRSFRGPGLKFQGPRLPDTLVVLNQPIYLKNMGQIGKSSPRGWK